MAVSAKPRPKRPPGDSWRRRHLHAREAPLAPAAPAAIFAAGEPLRFTCAVARVLRAGAVAVGEDGAAERAQPPPQGLGQRHAAAPRPAVAVVTGRGHAGAVGRRGRRRFPASRGPGR